MGKKKIIIYIALIIISIISYLGVKIIEKNHKTGLEGISISDVDISALENGTYSGSYGVFPVMAEVEVTIMDNVLTKIELIKHQNGQGKAAESILDKIIENQSLEVDVVTGATASSKVILKAVEIALTKLE